MLKPLYFLRFRALLFLLQKLANTLILLYLSLLFMPYFAMTERWIPACAGMTEGKWCKIYGKIASCKGYIVSWKPKKAKKNIEFTILIFRKLRPI